MSDLLSGLLAPYRAGAAAMPTGIGDNPLMSLALQSVMQQNAAPSFSGGGTGGGSPSTGGGGMTPMKGGNLQQWIDRAEQVTGVDSPNMDEMLRILISHESGGNPEIVNKTATPGGYHAAGLAQMIPPTFQSYNIPGLGGIFNPVANLSAAIKYMVDRYGGVAQTPGIASVLAGHGYQPY